VVIDTGVLVSAFVFGGVPAKAVKKAFAEADIFVSPELLQEYRDVPGELYEKEKIDDQQFQALIAGIATIVSDAAVAIPRKKLLLCRDPEDNMVLECCLATHADILITGDKDLLDIGAIPFPLLILTAGQYVVR